MKHLSITLTDGAKPLIRAHCNICLEVTYAPNKGLGRARIAAWKTQHQHETTAGSERVAAIRREAESE